MIPSYCKAVRVVVTGGARCQGQISAPQQSNKLAAAHTLRGMFLVYEFQIWQPMTQPSEEFSSTQT